MALGVSGFIIEPERLQFFSCRLVAKWVSKATDRKSYEAPTSSAASSPRGTCGRRTLRVKSHDAIYSGRTATGTTLTSGISG